MVIALTHIGFTENPASVEVDANVDSNLVMQTTGLDAVIGGHSHTNPATGFGLYKYLPTIIADKDGKPVVVNQAYRYNNTLGEVSLGLRDLGSGHYEVVSQTGRYLSVVSATPEDSEINDIVTPYTQLLAAYNDTVIGTTTAPIDTTNAYIAETNAANMQADAALYELGKNGITDVDFHLSGAMTRSTPAILFPGATSASPASMKISDMFTLMPYENSLVVLKMNGPQLKAVLERAYRNYYYYKYVPGYGGYSYYTTCMIDTNKGNVITYNDINNQPYDAGRDYVVSLVIGGTPVNFNDADTYYNVSTVNYLAAGSCNFNDGGVSLWPLDQIVHDTQYYVRDAVIDYVKGMGTVSPAVEGRLSFIYDLDVPVITINSPTATAYMHPDILKLDFSAVDVGAAGLNSVWADLDGAAVTNGQMIDLYTLALGSHTLNVYAMDNAGNQSSQSVTFTVDATLQSLQSGLTRLYKEGQIKSKGVYNSLMMKLVAAGKSKSNPATVILLKAYIYEVKAQSGRFITKNAANLLIADANWVINGIDLAAPVITINMPTAAAYLHTNSLTLDFNAVDEGTAGLKSVWADLDGVPVTNGQVIDLFTRFLGTHRLTVYALDNGYNFSSKSVTFTVKASIPSLQAGLTRLFTEGKIDSKGVYDALMSKLNSAANAGNKTAAIYYLNSFINDVRYQSGRHITRSAANLLINDATWVIHSLK